MITAKEARERLQKRKEDLCSEEVIDNFIKIVIEKLSEDVDKQINDLRDYASINLVDLRLHKNMSLLVELSKDKLLNSLKSLGYDVNSTLLREHLILRITF